MIGSILRPFSPAAMLLALCLCAPASAQKRGHEVNMRLNVDRPSVYIEYDHQGERHAVHANEGRTGLWLRIHNNTVWAMAIQTESLYLGRLVSPLKLDSGESVLGLRDGVEIAPLYSVEEEDGLGYKRVPVTYWGDTSAVSWIPSGGSVLMTVPMQNLIPGRRVALSFSYEREPDNGRIMHRAFFYQTQIP